MPKAKAYLWSKKLADHFSKWLHNHWFAFLTVPFLLSSLMLPPLFASASANTSFISSGTIVYPTPTPTPINAINLAPSDYNQWMDNPSNWDYISIDNTILRNGQPTLRCDPEYVRGTREINIRWINLEPGDHLRIGVWCKTSSYSSTDIAAGGRIGVDFYGSYIETPSQTVRIVDALPRDYKWIDGAYYSGPSTDYITWAYPEDGNESHFPVTLRSQFNVPFGSDWTYIYWDVVVPDKYFLFEDGHPQTKIIGAIVWLDARGLKEGVVWFSGAEIYINP